MSAEWSRESGHRADPDNITDSILGTLESHGYDADFDLPKVLDWDNPKHRQSVRDAFDGDTREQEAVWPGFGPDGKGGNARDDCGEAHPFVCDCCGRTIEFGRTCSQSTCGRCAIVWNRDLATKKAAKAVRFRRQKHWNTPEDEKQKFHHVVISPNLGWYRDLAQAGLDLDDAQDVTKDVVKDVLSELGGQGILVRHSYRVKKADGTLRSDHSSMGAYKELVYSNRAWEGDVRDQIAWKPHYHAIVVSDWIRADDLTKQVEDETGWVIHRIQNEESGKSLPDDGSMARALTYNLSHADIDVRDDAHNRSAVWEVGSFYGQLEDEGGPLKSTSAFKPTDYEQDWADAAVRDAAEEVLGLTPTTTSCDASIPGVDDPDEMARRIIEDLYPGEQRDVPEELVLHHVSEGNIKVDVSTTAGGGGDVTVSDAFGEPVGSWDGDLPTPATYGSGEEVEDPPAAVGVLDEDDGDAHDHDRGSDGSSSSTSEECDGTLRPLGEIRDRGLLEDDEWCRNAPHVEEAREADLEWSNDLPRWNFDPVGTHGPPQPG